MHRLKALNFPDPLVIAAAPCEPRKTSTDAALLQMPYRASRDLTSTLWTGWGGGERGLIRARRGVQAVSSINNNTDTAVQTYEYNTGPSGAGEDPQLH